MPEAFTAACFGMATLAAFSLFLPGRVTYVDSSGWAHKGLGGGGCAGTLFASGLLLVTILWVTKLSPDYYLVFAALVGSFAALLLPLVMMADFDGIASLRGMPLAVRSGESSSGVMAGRSAPRAILRKLMQVEREPSAGGYRDGEDRGVFRSKLGRVALRHSRRYEALLAFCLLLVLLAPLAALYQLIAIQQFGVVATRVFLGLLASTCLDLGVGFFSRRQLRRAVTELPEIVAAAHEAHPKEAKT